MITTTTYCYLQVGVSPQLVSELRHEYAPPDHEVFLLTPPAFNAAANMVYAHMGHPDVDHHSFWSVYRNLLAGLELLLLEGDLQGVVNEHAATVQQMNTDNEAVNQMDLLPNQRRRALNDVTVGFQVVERTGQEGYESDVAYAAFSDDEIEDNSD